jgi:3-oxoacyl-(acyl-carrier-protein) synthase
VRVTAAITGWAWRTPLGSSVDGVRDRLLAGGRADPAPGGVLARPIAQAPRDSRHGRYLPRLGLLAVEAAAEALAGSGAGTGERLALFAACGGLRVAWDETLPALERQGQGGAGPWESGLRGLHPFWLLRHLSNNVQALASAELGARGEGATFGGAGSGAQALSAAIRTLAAGAADAAVVVAYDALLDPEATIELRARGALAPSADAPGPYDDGAAGIVPGEGAAAVVLERAPRAGARALALVDAVAVADGEEWEPRAATIARALAAVARGERIVDGAARARPSLDASERQAIAEVVGGDAILLGLGSATGALGAATPLVQTIALAALLSAGRLPPIAGLGRAAAGPLRPLLAAEATRERAALGLSTGAPGLAAAVRVELP